MNATLETPPSTYRDGLASPPQRWAVVGGGFLGMEIARQLRAANHDVTLIERAPNLGGLADSWSVGEVTWDRHYHVILMSDLRVRELLDQLGIADALRWVETKTGFFTDGKLVSMSNAVEFLKFPPLRLIDKIRLGSTIFYASKIRNWKRLETIPVVDWLRSWSGTRTTEKIWLPLLRAKLGENYRYASAAFIWAIIARMYAARRTGLKKEMFGYARGGYGKIIDHFADALRTAGIEISAGTAVRSIAKSADGLRVETADGSHATYDRVVVTAAAPVVPLLCPDLPTNEANRWRNLRYQGIVCASLVLKKPLANYYVTNITESWVPFTAVIEMTTLVDPAEFDGKTLIYLPKYVTPDDPLFDASDDTIRESFIGALAKMYPHFTPDDVLAFRVSRVRHVLAIPTIDYSANLPPMVTSIPGLYVANSAHIVNGTLNVNETLQLADRAVAQLLSEVRA